MDLWSFGIIVFEMLTKKHPYSKTAEGLQLLKMIKAKKFDAQHYKLKVDDDCKDLLNGLLERDPAKREWSVLEESKWLK